MSTAIDEVFECYVQIVNPEGGGEKVFAFDSHRLIKSLCRVWADLYGTVVTSGEEVLRDKALLGQEVKKLLGGGEGRVKKLAGKLNVCRQQLRAVRDSLMEGGTTIAQLKQKIAALLIKPSHVVKPHIEHKAGVD